MILCLSWKGLTKEDDETKYRTRLLTVLTYVNFPIYNPFTKRIYKKRLDLHAAIYNNLHLVN